MYVSTPLATSPSTTPSTSTSYFCTTASPFASAVHWTVADLDATAPALTTGADGWTGKVRTAMVGELESFSVVILRT